MIKIVLYCKNILTLSFTFSIIRIYIIVIYIWKVDLELTRLQKMWKKWRTDRRKQPLNVQTNRLTRIDYCDWLIGWFITETSVRKENMWTCVYFDNMQNCQKNHFNPENIDHSWIHLFWIIVVYNEMMHDRREPSILQDISILLDACALKLSLRCQHGLGDCYPAWQCETSFFMTSGNAHFFIEEACLLVVNKSYG